MFNNTRLCRKTRQARLKLRTLNCHCPLRVTKAVCLCRLRPERSANTLVIFNFAVQTEILLLNYIWNTLHLFVCFFGILVKSAIYDCCCPCCVEAACYTKCHLQAKDTHMFVEEQIDEYFPELLELPGM